MPNYNQSKIYAILPKGVKLEDANGDVYIGSTTNMTKRKSTHKRDFEKEVSACSSRYLFEKIGVDNCEFIILEHYSCNTKSELIIREQLYINNNPCVNQHRAFVDIETKKIEKDAYNKIYVKEHKPEKKAYDKIYVKEHKAERKIYDKEYCEKNKGMIKQRRSELIECECGCSVKKMSLWKHKKTPKHINLLLLS